MMHSDDILRLKAEQESLEALLTAATSGSDKALAQLKGKTDPSSIRRQLVILLQEKRFKEAADLVRGKPSDEEWCDLAIQALGANGDMAEAERMLAESSYRDNRTKRRKCNFAFAQVLFHNAFAEDQTNKNGLPTYNTAALVRARTILAPIATSVEATARIETEFEQSVMELMLKILHFLGDRGECQKVADLLASRQPVSLALAEGMLQEWFEKGPKDLPQRLRKDHPQSFEAVFMATALEGLHDPDRALQAARQILPQARNTNERFRLWKLLEGLAIRAGGHAQADLAQYLDPLLAGDEFLSPLRAAEACIRGGQLVEARELLQKVHRQDDVYWLQLWADLNFRTGDAEAGLSSLKQAARLFPNPDLYERVGEAALNLNKLDEAAQLLKQQLLLEPQNIPARARLAFVLLEKEDYTTAADQFSELRRLQPDEPAHPVNQALCLQLLGKAEASLEILNSVCASEHPPVQALAARAEIQKAMNRPESGFDGLRKVKANYWDDPRFVSTFMALAHAAQDEKSAHEAFLQLQQLQQQGKTQLILRPVSLDEMKGHLQEFHKKREELLALSMQGKVPWLLVEQFMGRVPYWGWHLRTQKLDWLSEDPLIVAQHSVYSTNSFSVRKAPNGQGVLEELESPPKSTAVAVDLSSLITLHRLGLLEHAAAFFQKLLIPSTYIAKVLEESSSLVLHQKSQKTSLQEIKAALDTQKIKVHTGSQVPGGPLLPRVHEHSLDSETGHLYRLRDVADALMRDGRISDSEQKELLSVAHHQTAVDPEHLPLKIAQPVLIDLSTLTTLHSIKLLTHCIAAFEVHITESTRDDVVRDLRGYEALERVYNWHRDMWDKIRGDKRFIMIPRRVTGANEGKEFASDRDIYLSALHLALEQNLPLLADDRVCQSLSLNERTHFKCAAFGTDKLLPALAEAGLITWDQAADAILQLTSWRYRFIVIPTKLLSNIARRYASSPPGVALRSVARYVHDCMRDPGLLSGLEQTDPPTAVSTRLFQKWATVTAEFIMETWADKSVSEDTATKLTRWAVQELLPSPPKTMPYPAAEILTSLVPRIAVANALIYSGRVTDPERANKALLALAREMGTGPAEYFRYVTDTIDAIRDHKQ